jgi:gamma-glutamyltranspeptidase / glutathione hydrolase
MDHGRSIAHVRHSKLVRPYHHAIATRVAAAFHTVLRSKDKFRRIGSSPARCCGLLSARDRAEYQAVRRKPLESTYRGFRVTTNCPPGGGVMLLEMLKVLEHFDLKALRRNSPDYIVTLAEAMKRATADKDRCVGDPQFRTDSAGAAHLEGVRERAGR